MGSAEEKLQQVREIRDMIKAKLIDTPQTDFAGDPARGWIK
jgi:hypothetical protein